MENQYSLATTSLLYTQEKFGMKKRPQIILDSTNDKDIDVVDIVG